VVVKLRLAGVTFNNPDGSSRQGILRDVSNGTSPYKDGCQFKIVSETYKGEQAFGVAAIPGNGANPEGKTVGYIPKDWVAYVADRISSMEPVSGYEFYGEDIIGIELALSFVDGPDAKGGTSVADDEEEKNRSVGPLKWQLDGFVEMYEYANEPIDGFGRFGIPGDIRVGDRVDLEATNIASANGSGRVSVLFKGDRIGYLPDNNKTVMCMDYWQSGGKVLARISSLQMGVPRLEIGYFRDEAYVLESRLARGDKHTKVTLVSNRSEAVQDNLLFCRDHCTVYYEFDDDRDKFAVYSGSRLIGYFPSRKEDLLESEPDVYLLDVPELDNGKYGAIVVVFEE
jgi:hypothetical protein